MSEPEPITSIRTPIELEYTATAGKATTLFLKGIAEGRILGQRCPVDGKVYVPGRGACPQHGVATDGGVVEVADRGTLTTFCIVRIPSENLSVDPPFVSAHVLLDGADIPLFHLIQECKLEDVHMGMRLQAVWADELEPTMASIKYFRPLDEPDAPFESYAEHL